MDFSSVIFVSPREALHDWQPKIFNFTSCKLTLYDWLLHTNRRFPSILLSLDDNRRLKLWCCWCQFVFTVHKPRGWALYECYESNTHQTSSESSSHSAPYLHVLHLVNFFPTSEPEPSSSEGCKEENFKNDWAFKQWWLLICFFLQFKLLFVNPFWTRRRCSEQWFIPICTNISHGSISSVFEENSTKYYHTLVSCSYAIWRVFFFIKEHTH